VKRIVILISGRGSNMEALINADLPAAVAAVISNNPAAGGLVMARRRGVTSAVIDHRAFSNRPAFDAALAREIDSHQPDLVVLAGFMRVLTETFVDHYRGRMLNIHPSLLPAFPGLDTHRRALEAGVRIHGCTVHFVTHALDSGPIVVQAAVPVQAGDTEERLAARVLAQEHRIYPQAARWLAQGRVEFHGEDVVQVRGSGVETDWAVAPRDPP
jgi:phosphoribosylglycinamide formyltransferase-1